MPKKKPAQIVNQLTSSMMDSQLFANGVFDAASVKSDSFGNVSTSKNETSFLGFSFGFKKATLSAGFLNFPDTVNPKSSKSKIIGFTKPQSAISISLPSNMSSMTALILDATTALSPS